MNDYNSYIADLIDRGKTNTQIVRAILRLEAIKKFTAPIKIFVRCDQLRILWQSMSRNERRKSQYQLNQYPPYGFLDNEPWVDGMRIVFRSSGYNLPLNELPIWLLQVLEKSDAARDCFLGRRNHQLDQLGVFDGNGHWSERRFQKMVAYITGASSCGIAPDFNLLENYMNQVAMP